MKGIIYKYTFPDGKVYIGQTRNPEKRKREHAETWMSGDSYLCILLLNYR